MSINKKIYEFATSFSGGYGFPIEEHIPYWLSKHQEYLDNENAKISLILQKKAISVLM